MKRVALLVLLALSSSTAEAQPAEALGKPLMAPDLPAGTITVRVIAGEPGAVVAGFDVTLVVNGTARTARTDAEGRATFGGLAPGATVHAEIAAAEGPISSSEFQVPDGNGAKLMLSTKPMTAAAPVGGPPGMPNPRNITGMAREESADPPGTLTVLVTYADMTGTNPPVGQDVVLVGYTIDDKVTVARKSTDKGGRVELTGLDISGATVYYAMTLLPRGTGVDRLISQPTQMIPGMGMRMLLSGETRTSTAPPIDDITRLQTQLPNVPAGVAAVAVLARDPDDGGTADLVDATTGKVLASERLGKAGDAGLNSNSRFGGFEPDPAAPPGTLRVFAVGGTDGGPLSEATVALIPAAPGAQVPPAQETDANGKATFTGVAPGQWRVSLDAGPAKAESDPITVPANQGGRVVAVMSWFDGVPPRLVRLAGIPATADPVFVRLRIKGAVRKSLPFQAMPDRGTTAPFELGPQLLFAIVADGSVDDRYLGFSGRFTIANTWWTPYRASDDGMIIPGPRGFTGGVVGEEDKKLVSPVPYEGFQIVRPIKPGQTSFQAGFSLKIDDGIAAWSLDLPWGAVQSRIAILDSPGMTVELPGKIGSCALDPRTGQLPDGCKESAAGMKFYLIDDINIDPGHSMVMRVRGLPVVPWWKIWLPRFAGVIVLGVLGLTLFLTLRARRASPTATASARIQQLMDELVELEKKGQGGQRKDQLLAELERLWEADGRTGRAA